MTELLSALGSAVGVENVLHGPIGQFIFSKDAGLHRSTPAVAVLPANTAEVQSIMRIAKEFNRAVVVRGAGSGLTGGAVGGPESIIVVMTRMDAIWEIDEENRTALVGPGVINLDLSIATKGAGLHFAPDPSSQSVCTIGGNVGNNAGGPHCLAEGSTVNHILGIEIVTAEGEITTVGGKGPQPVGLDLRGVLVGSEGTLGIATQILVKLTQNPPATGTFLIAFSQVEQATATVTDIIASGVVPAALELMDQNTVRVVENFIHAGMNTDAAALLLVEVMGHQAGVESETTMITEIARRNGAFEVRVAQDDTERDQFWKGRKAAFGAVAQLSPDFYLHDTVVPRHKLVEVMTAIYEIGERYDLIMMNVFHAGDGNLHPILGFDLRREGEHEKVIAASKEILEVCVAAGGALSGEHGIGIEKRDYMPLIFSPTDLDAQARLQDAFDPQARLNPDKVLPTGARCAEFGQTIPKGAWV
jgi:glycolate oxidase